MARPEDIRPITEGIYRERRAYLADHVFAGVPAGGKPPDDLLGEEQWANLTDLATDVLLRTTDYLGSMIDDMLTQDYAWLCVLPTDPSSAPFVFDAHLDAHDEFKAAPFIAAHGWYRQATAALRNALEVMTHAVRFAVRNDNAGFQAWRSGTADAPRFGNSVDLIGQNPAVAQIDATLGTPGIFGVNPNGVLRSRRDRPATQHLPGDRSPPVPTHTMINLTRITRIMAQVPLHIVDRHTAVQTGWWPPYAGTGGVRLKSIRAPTASRTSRWPATQARPNSSRYDHHNASARA